MAKRKKLTTILISISIGCIIIVLMLFVLPQFWPQYACKSPCAAVESDASNIAAAISDHFAVPEHTDIKHADIASSFTPHNPWTLIKCGEKIYIYVYDHEEGCPVDYQNAAPNWDSHIYTKIFEP
jgi:hypothetical protein